MSGNIRSNDSIDKRPPDLFIAAVNNDVFEMEAALREGQSLSFRNPTDLLFTPVHVAASKGSLDFIQAAASHETFDVWARDANGRVAADHALAHRKTEVEQFLTHKMYAHLFDTTIPSPAVPDDEPQPGA